LQTDYFIIFQERIIIRNVSKYKVLQIQKSKITNVRKSLQYCDTVSKCTVRVQSKELSADFDDLFFCNTKFSRIYFISYRRSVSAEHSWTSAQLSSGWQRCVELYKILPLIRPDHSVDCLIVGITRRIVSIKRSAGMLGYRLWLLYCMLSPGVFSN